MKEDINEICESGDNWECPVCHSIMLIEDKPLHIKTEVKEIQEALKCLKDL